MEARANIRLGRTADGISKPIEGSTRIDKGHIRPKINKTDIYEHGEALGCRACAAASRGETQTGIAHTEACRKRFEKIWKENEDPRYDRLLEKTAEAGEKLLKEEEHQQHLQDKSHSSIIICAGLCVDHFGLSGTR